MWTMLELCLHWQSAAKRLADRNPRRTIGADTLTKLWSTRSCETWAQVRDHHEPTAYQSPISRQTGCGCSIPRACLATRPPLRQSTGANQMQAAVDNTRRHWLRCCRPCWNEFRSPSCCSVLALPTASQRHTRLALIGRLGWVGVSFSV